MDHGSVQQHRPARLDIHGIRTTVKGGNAHGIAVYGSSGTAPITGITISRNRVHDLKLGSSETAVLNGNVDGWQVVGNTIDNVDNIGVELASEAHEGATSDVVLRNSLVTLSAQQRDPRHAPRDHDDERLS